MRLQCFVFCILVLVGVSIGLVSAYMGLNSYLYGEDEVWRAQRPYTWEADMLTRDDLRRFEELGPTQAAVEFAKSSYPPWQERRVARQILPRLEEQISEEGFRDPELDMSRMGVLISLCQVLRDFERLESWATLASQEDGDVTSELAKMVLKNPSSYRGEGYIQWPYMLNRYDDVRWLMYHYSGYFMIISGLVLIISIKPLIACSGGGGTAAWPIRVFMLTKYLLLTSGFLLLCFGMSHIVWLSLA